MPAKKPDNSIKTPKGMRDLLGEEYFTYQGFFEKAAEIALYYGFKPIETPIMEREELFHSVGEHTDVVTKEMYALKAKGSNKFALRPEGTAPVMRAYIEHGMQTWPQPVMLYYGGRFFRHDNPQRGRFREFRQFGLEVIGTDKSIADAMTIKVMATVLEEVGIENIVVDINSLGDKECRTAYKRALVNYFKKHSGKLNAHEKDLLKNNPLRLLDSKNPELEKLKEDAPTSMEFLTGESKKHFKEVLEYLDALDITYQINNTLVRGLDYYSRTVFEFIEQPKEAPEGEGGDKKEEASAPLSLGGGGRYNYLGKALGAKQDVPGVGAALGVDRILMDESVKNLTPRIVKKPKVYFIQLGFEAKLKSLGVIEILRKARLPIRQSLSKDGLSAQLGTAEKLRIPWVVIMGQKEVLENCVIVRNMEDRSQTNVPIEELADYIKKVIAK
ncbi:histidine--tRNA ligase [bacterium]|nr:histidine--tRNA ligase [bacterium]|tara:strand:+ start:26465 stop:27793 length:1329 start_codon:yes stop_codon:yes gene_type:complete